MKRLLVVTSTLPATVDDPVPGFVKDQAIWLKRAHSGLAIDILAPHTPLSPTAKLTIHEAYTEHRFHYFWPRRWELVAGHGTMSALAKYRLLYLQVPLLFIGQFFALWRLTRRLKPNLLYAHWFTPQAIVAAVVSKLTGVPLVFTTHASDIIVLKKMPGFRLIVRLVCRRAVGYTAVSQQTADKLIYFAKARTADAIRAKLRIIPMGANPLPPAHRTAIDRTKRKFGLTAPKQVLFIGRLVPRKGVEYLLEAFAKIADIHKDAQLIIAGDGPSKASLEALTKRLDLSTKQVIFPGFISGETKDSLLHLSDIVCLPSINIGDQSEGMPVAFMEGLEAGKTIVASDVTGAQEYLIDGRDGFLFRQKDTAELATKLKLALGLNGAAKVKLSQAAKKLGGRFEWQRVAKEHYDFFEEALRG